MRFYLLFILSAILLSFSADAQKKLSSHKITKPIKIDGILNEEAWSEAGKASGFVQRGPVPGSDPSQVTEVSILYNNTYIYVGAWLYDENPEGIMTELNGRDQSGNTDMFTVYFDTYRDGLSAFEFSLTAAGVQRDSRISPGNYDLNWNVGWYSEVTITNEGWFVEMEIPLSVLRFPAKDVQEWGLNFRRVIQRNNESVYWNEINPRINGFVNQFGLLTDLEGIKTPLRLSVIPYLSAYLNRHYDPETNTAGTGTNIRGGMDIKYGINDAFTLDMMLVPDFGQVVSDNNVLNLGPYEVYNTERRQFFIEGTELFEKANIFYSRRIGGKPVMYDQVGDQLEAGEEIVSNPTESRIINATKISGRTKGGLGIGFLNALTNRTSAVIRNEQGEEREIITSPLVNYNVSVIDQSLKNNSYVSFINTNVTRFEGFADANVSGTSMRLSDKTNMYAFGGKAIVSHLYGFPEQDNDTGFNTNFWVGKTSGNILYRVGHNLESDNYNPNDLGFVRAVNDNNFYANIEYREYDPFYKFLNFRAGFGVNYFREYKPNVFTGLEFETSVRATFKNFLTTRVWFDISPLESKEFDDTRTAGVFIYEPSYHNLGVSFYTDSRKKFRMSSWMYYYQTSQSGRNYVSMSLSPRLRINDQLSISTSLSGSNSSNSIGYVSTTGDDINFGVRDITSFTNIVTTKFTFNREMDLYFRMRHYWSSAQYKDYYTLGSEGRLHDTDYSDSHDVNFTSFNIDMVYTWIFSPASEFSVVWKSSALNQTDRPEYNYYENFMSTFDAGRDNSISFKVLYYLDYVMLTRSRHAG